MNKGEELRSRWYSELHETELVSESEWRTFDRDYSYLALIKLDQILEILKKLDKCKCCKED